MITKSLWQKSLHSQPLVESSSLSQCSFDVTIIGAGISGLSLAYWLKKLAPPLSILVVDQGPSFATGASGKNAGFNTVGSFSYLASLITKWGADKARDYWSFKQDALREMQNELKKFTDQADFDRQGSTTLYQTAAMAEEQKDLIVAALGDFPGLVWDSTELAKTGLSQFSRGFFLPTEGQLHPVKFLEKMFMFLRIQGVAFSFSTQVFDVRNENAKLSFKSQHKHWQSEHVFWATNGYTQEAPFQLHQTLESSLLITPKRAQMAAYEIEELPRWQGNHYDPAGKVYFRCYEDTCNQKKWFLIGGFRLLDEKHENSLHDKVNPIIQSAFDEYVQVTMKLKTRDSLRWAGTMGFTPHELPLLEQSGKWTFLGGYSGHGMGIAFKLAELAAHQYLGQTFENGQFFSLSYWTK